MPATAIQKNAPFQCRCTNGANRGRSLSPGALVSVSLGFTFCGTTSLPFKRALPVTALCRGKLRRFNLPEPIVVFFTNLVVVLFLMVCPVPFCTNLDLVALRMVGLCDCTVREGATNRAPLEAASAGAASKSVKPTTAAATAATTIVVLISAAPCFCGCFLDLPAGSCPPLTAPARSPRRLQPPMHWKGSMPSAIAATPWPQPYSICASRARGAAPRGRSIARP